ncbi:serine kinase [Brasilonema octagenarum]|uniref:serine kinase n=1 Tax=Brasilonema octagenarum TaxID=417105 RepID=UPI002006ECBC|nr:serine kinase [Brasilonema octagenarum]
MKIHSYSLKFFPNNQKGDSKVFAYSAYNLCIHSKLAFPELMPSELIPEITRQQPDVVISKGQIGDFENEAANGGLRLVGFLKLENSTVGRFLVELGHKIVVEPDPGIDEDLLRPFILGPAIAVLLRQRGLLVLHASSIAVKGGAIAFLGHSGWGKSTLAEAFHTKDYSILTDDLMAVKMDTDQPIVFPGFPQVKLWSDAATSLGHTPENLPLLHSMTEKRVLRFSEGFCQKLLPLKRLYVLDKGTKHTIEPLHPANAFMELVRYSRAVNLLQTPDFTKTHFEQCQKLVKQVPVCRLQRQFSLDALPDLVKLIEEDIKEGVYTS